VFTFECSDHLYLYVLVGITNKVKTCSGIK
jgi:hypothetical protein